MPISQKRGVTFTGSRSRVRYRSPITLTLVIRVLGLAVGGDAIYDVSKVALQTTAVTPHPVKCDPLAFCEDNVADGPTGNVTVSGTFPNQSVTVTQSGSNGFTVTSTYSFISRIAVGKERAGTCYDERPATTHPEWYLRVAGSCESR